MSQSAGSGTQLQRQQEAALQRILEEEILKEMDREAALREVGVTLVSWPYQSCMRLAVATLVVASWGWCCMQLQHI